MLCKKTNTELVCGRYKKTDKMVYTIWRVSILVTTKLCRATTKQICSINKLRSQEKLVTLQAGPFMTLLQASPNFRVYILSHRTLKLKELQLLSSVRQVYELMKIIPCLAWNWRHLDRWNCHQMQMKQVSSIRCIKTRSRVVIMLEATKPVSTGLSATTAST